MSPEGVFLASIDNKSTYHRATERLLGDTEYGIWKYARLAGSFGHLGTKIKFTQRK